MERWTIADVAEVAALGAAAHEAAQLLAQRVTAIAGMPVLRRPPGAPPSEPLVFLLVDARQEAILGGLGDAVRSLRCGPDRRLVVGWDIPQRPRDQSPVAADRAARLPRLQRIARHLGGVVIEPVEAGAPAGLAELAWAWLENLLLPGLIGFDIADLMTIATPPAAGFFGLAPLQDCVERGAAWPAPLVAGLRPYRDLVTLRIRYSDGLALLDELATRCSERFGDGADVMFGCPATGAQEPGVALTELYAEREG